MFFLSICSYEEEYLFLSFFYIALISPDLGVGDNRGTILGSLLESYYLRVYTRGPLLS